MEEVIGGRGEVIGHGEGKAGPGPHQPETAIRASQPGGLETCLPARLWARLIPLAPLPPAVGLLAQWGSWLSGPCARSSPPHHRRLLTARRGPSLGVPVSSQLTWATGPAS